MAKRPTEIMKGTLDLLVLKTLALEPREWGCPPPLVAEIAGDQLRRGLAVARMERGRAEAEGPTSSK